MEKLILKDLKSNEAITLKRLNKLGDARSAMDDSRIVIANEEWIFVEENEPVPDRLVALLHNVYVGQIILDQYEIVGLD